MLEREHSEKLVSLQESLKHSEDKLRSNKELSDDLQSKVLSLEATVSEQTIALEEETHKNGLDLSKIEELELSLTQKHQELEESAKKNQFMQEKLESIESTLSKGKCKALKFFFRIYRLYLDDSELKKATAQAEEKYLEASNRLANCLKENIDLKRDLSTMCRRG